jgi:S-adenosylmethionine:tRNA ribosyltransferase-isomerase
MAPAVAITPAPRFAPATEPRRVAQTRLLVATTAPALALRDARFSELPSVLRPGDVCVVNDAATLPASLAATVGPARGPAEPVELRLLGSPDERGEALALLFGGGDWRTPTEHRPIPPRLAPGDEVRAGALRGVVVAVTSRGRVARERFDGERDAIVRALYARGRPVQYAHVSEPLPLWEVQNVYASEPWAVEMPSAGRPIDFDTLAALRARGVEVVPLTHGAGPSSTGDEALDASLPWTERYRIPRRTALAVREAERVIAVGTSVVRALEACALRFGKVCETEGVTDLRVDAAHELRAVNGLLTGMHDQTTSHAALLAAFLPAPALGRLIAHALAARYLGHEFGDSCLILPA